MLDPTNYTSLPDWWSLLYGDYTNPYWAGQWDSGGDGGNGVPTFSVTATGLADKPPNEYIDYSWLFQPPDSNSSGPPTTNDPGSGGAPGPGPGETLTFPIDVWGLPINESTPVSPDPSTITGPGLLPSTYDDWQPTPETPPGMDPTQIPYVPDDGIPTFSVTTHSPQVPYVPDDGIPTFPITTYAPQVPIGSTLPPLHDVTYMPRFSPDPTSFTTPGNTPSSPPAAGNGRSLPSLPNINIPVGNGAPGPGLMAPVVGDPNPKKSLFTGIPKQADIQSLAEILAPILLGGYNAKSK
jgi:hypothetical protein